LTVNHPKLLLANGSFRATNIYENLIFLPIKSLGGYALIETMGLGA
jgi:hypothetical protein